MKKVIISSLKFLILTIVFSVSQVLSQNNINLQGNVRLSFNGCFVYDVPTKAEVVISENGVFRCTFDIDNVGDEIRELKNIRLYENDRLNFHLPNFNGCDILVSDKGTIVIFDTRYHFNNELTLRFLTKEGKDLITKTFKGVSVSGFSPKCEKFVVGNSKNIFVIDLLSLKTEVFNGGFEVSFSDNEKYCAISKDGIISIYQNKILQTQTETGFSYVRKILMSEKYNFIAAIDKKNLKVFSLQNCNLLFSDKLDVNLSYRDLLLRDGQIYAGIHYRFNGVSQGILKVYDLNGKKIIEKVGEEKTYQTFPKQKSQLEYDQIPWPFIPFNEIHTVWNHYEQHMGYGTGDWSYLHQGLDIITPVNEPTYAVAEGWVKCVLTLGGDVYWRIAISPEQVSGYSNGWLYAHLVESSIQFDVGDYVQLHDYLGDIIYWSSDWGHIHFVEIRDVGTVWSYDDNEWGINFNPLLALNPNTDTVIPIIEDVFTYSKFGFCENETSNYLYPDNLHGDIDIIVKISDYHSDSPWEQPAYKTYYWVKKLPENTIVFPKTLGQILNHTYDFYAGFHYEDYAPLIYKKDYLLPAPSWMNEDRDYYQILTNNNGDSIADLPETELAFATTDFYDGDYRIFIEAWDVYGNNTVDSQDVVFINGIIPAIDPISDNDKFFVYQNVPNPFSDFTTIKYYLPPDAGKEVIITIYDSQYRQIKKYINLQPAIGINQTVIDVKSLPCGIYYYIVEAGKYKNVNKCIYLQI